MRLDKQKKKRNSSEATLAGRSDELSPNQSETIINKTLSNIRNLSDKKVYLLLGILTLVEISIFVPGLDCKFYVASEDPYAECNLDIGPGQCTYPCCEFYLQKFEPVQREIRDFETEGIKNDTS